MVAIMYKLRYLCQTFVSNWPCLNEYESLNSHPFQTFPEMGDVRRVQS